MRTNRIEEGTTTTAAHTRIIRHSTYFMGRKKKEENKTKRFKYRSKVGPFDVL